MPILLVLWAASALPPLLAETPDSHPLLSEPTDGLVKRLEELERTAELYKGGRTWPGSRRPAPKMMVGVGGRNASRKVLGPGPLRILLKSLKALSGYKSNTYTQAFK